MLSRHAGFFYFIFLMGCLFLPLILMLTSVYPDMETSKCAPKVTEDEFQHGANVNTLCCFVANIIKAAVIQNTTWIYRKQGRC